MFLLVPVFVKCEAVFYLFSLATEQFMWYVSSRYTQNSITYWHDPQWDEWKPIAEISDTTGGLHVISGLN